MTLRFKCDCGRLIVVPQTQAGKRAPCPRCGKPVRAPLSAAAGLPVLPAADPPVLPEAPRGPPSDSLPLLPLELEEARPRRRTTAVLRRDAEPSSGAPPDRPRVEVAGRPCPECAEEINARAEECFYCEAKRIKPLEGGKTRRILPGQLGRGAEGLAGLAQRLALVGLIVPVYAISLAAIAVGCRAFFATTRQQPAVTRRALLAVGLGVAGCGLSTALVVWLTR